MDLETASFSDNNFKFLSPRLKTSPTAESWNRWPSCSRSMAIKSTELYYLCVIQLKELHLHFTGIAVLPRGYTALQSLEVLSLSETPIRVLPCCLSRLARLHTLTVSDQSVVPASLSTLSTLRTLGWTNCHRGDVERLLACMSPWSASLENLDLANSEFLSLPDSVSQLRGLRMLNLSGCDDLASLPQSMRSMTSLEYVVLESCWTLTALPPGFNSLPRLAVLDLRSTTAEGCCKVRWPRPTPFCSILEETLRGGLGGSLGGGPGGVPVGVPGGMPGGVSGGVPGAGPGFTSLQALNLEDALVEALPEGFFQLTTLVRLELQGNLKLVEIPAGISSLVRLQSLDLSKCTGLVRLPESIGGLTALEASAF